MPHPKDVFDHPDRYWAFITAPADMDFEDQCFDRKQVPGTAKSGLVKRSELAAFKEEVIECLSAFANANPEGGLLVLGVATNGAVKGFGHLTDEQRQSITEVEKLLRNQVAQVRFFECQNEHAATDRICLMYVHYCTAGIVERVGHSPKAWTRQGVRNVPMSDDQKERLRRDKRIVDYENAYCCPFDDLELDRTVIQEFRRGFLGQSDQQYSDIELLWKAGALRREHDGMYSFNTAGYLFFAANPQRILSAAYIRLLRFEPLSETADRGLPTFDRDFIGPVTSQIRQLRMFLKESAFFKTYQRRNKGGGFTEEPEFPLLAVDEAVVNAVVHRDYAMTVPVTCESYADAFVVSNAGRVLQGAIRVPNEFSLNEVALDSTPRNPKLIQWLKCMKDEHGRSFIQALGEGTKRMRAEMERIGLPSPLFRLGEAQTTVILFNNAGERGPASANLIPLKTLQAGQFTRRREDGRIRKAVVPVVDWGVRFLPFTKKLPQAMLPLVDTPVIDLVVAEALSAGIEEVMLVTGHGKRIVEDHFDRSIELESVLDRKDVYLQRIFTLSDAHLHFVRQSAALGIGHAVYQARHFVGGERFAVLLPDIVYPDVSQGLVKLVSLADQYGDSVVGLLGPESKPRRDVVGASDISQGTTGLALDEKEIPWGGRFVLSSEVFSILETQNPGKRGEIQLTDAIASLARQRPVYSHEVMGPVYELGTKPGYVRAFMAFALGLADARSEVLHNRALSEELKSVIEAIYNDTDMRPEFERYLKGLLTGGRASY